MNTGSIRILASFALGMTLIGGAPTAATAQHMNQPDTPCFEARSGAELTACFAKAAQTADARLNDTYAAIVKALAPEDRDRLQAAERAWLAYRDRFCDGEYGLYGGGSGGPSAQQACLEALTRHHEAELKAGYGWRVEKATGAAFSDRYDVDQIVHRLDLTSFANSVAPRREPDKHSFADYGFTRVEAQAHGAVLTEDDDEWQMAFDIVAITPDTIDICFHDQALRRPGQDAGSSYNTTSALRITRSEHGRWTAQDLKAGLPGCVVHEG